MEGGEEEKQIAGVGAGKSVLEEMNGGLQTDGENALGEIDLENEQANEQQNELAGEKRIVGAKHVLRRHLDDAREEGENGLLFLKMKRIEREKIRARLIRRPSESIRRIGQGGRAWLRSALRPIQRTEWSSESPERGGQSVRRSIESRLRSREGRVGTARSPSPERTGRFRASRR